VEVVVEEIEGCREVFGSGLFDEFGKVRSGLRGERVSSGGGGGG
jgi:hypothetical protein